MGETIAIDGVDLAFVGEPNCQKYIKCIIDRRADIALRCLPINQFFGFKLTVFFELFTPNSIKREGLSYASS
jgi:hypothetical protein